MKPAQTPLATNPEAHPVVLWSRLKLRWPFLVWLLAVAFCVWMLLQSTEFQHLRGVVYVENEDVASLETARVQDILVSVGQVVTQGQLLVKMDTGVLDAEMGIEKLQIRRQFDQLILRHEENLSKLEIDLASSRAELGIIEAERARLEGLVEKRLVDPETFMNVRAREEALKTVVTLYPKRIDALQSQLEQTRAQKKSLLDSLSEQVDLADLPVGTEQDSRELSLLQKRRQNFLLRAQRDGKVSVVEKGEGEIVPAGETIVTLVVSDPVEVLGFLPESNVKDVVVGMKAEVFRRPGDTIYKAVVTALDPQVRALPGRVSNIPGRTTRGVRVILTLEDVTGLTPGEAVTIRILEKSMKAGRAQ